MVGSHFKLSKEYLRVALGTALEYRGSFIFEIFSMILNDCVWLFFWFIFFNKFTEINHWNYQDFLLLYGIAAASYGIASVLYGNRHDIANIISHGKLDFYLTLPKNILYHALITKTGWSGLGDLLVGIFIAIFFLDPIKIPLFVLFTLTATIIFVAAGVLYGSLAFYFGEAEETSKTLAFANLTFATYPLSIFQGPTRFALFTIMPAAFISGVPVELLKQFNLFWFIATIVFAFIFLGIAVFVFYRGLRRYESGNLMYVRT